MSATSAAFAAASRLFKQHAGTLLPLALLLYAPAILLRFAAARDAVGLMLLAGVVEWTLTPALSAVLAAATTVNGDLYAGARAVRPHALRLLGASFLTSLAVIAGAGLLLVPGLLAAALLTPAATLASRGAAPLEALERSASAVRERFSELGLPALGGIALSTALPPLLGLLAMATLGGNGGAIAPGVTDAIDLALNAVNAGVTAWLACLFAVLAARVDARPK